MNQETTEQENTQELVEYHEAEQQLAEASDTATQLIALVERVALDPAIDVAKMEKLLDMQIRVLDRQAEAEFNQAMNRAQQKMSPVAADSHNKQTNSDYASYKALDKALRPVYTSEGFAISYTTEDCPYTSEERPLVRVVAIVTHSAGHTRKYTVDMDASGKGAKGGDVMTRTHASGSAMSYGMRYLLKLIFNVAIGEDDDDGNSADVELITESQAADLQAKVEEVGANKEKVLKFFRINKFADIPAKNYNEVISWLNAYAKQQAKKQQGGDS